MFNHNNMNKKIFYHYQVYLKETVTVEDCLSLLYFDTVYSVLFQSFPTNTTNVYVHNILIKVKGTSFPAIKAFRQKNLL